MAGLTHQTSFSQAEFATKKKITRRTMTAERNLRPSFSVDMKQPAEAFHAAFDAFCLRWNLYGMQPDEPLLLKLAVNLTPYTETTGGREPKPRTRAFLASGGG